MNDNLKRERQLTKERQLAATVTAGAEIDARQNALAELSAPPRPGDVFLSRRTADYPVEWLVIEDGENGRARVVPVDEHPYAGSRDLELAAESLGGAAVVRCDLDAQIDATELEPELRTGALRELELGRVRRKRRAIEDGTLEPSLLEEVVDGDPEYGRWRDGTLQPAIDALAGRVREAKPTAPHRRRWLPAVAAAAVLAVALPLGWQVYQLSRQLGHEQERVAEIEAERQALEARLDATEAERQSAEREVGRLEASIDQAAAGATRVLVEQKERFDARLRRVLDDSVVVNVPSFVFGRMARVRSSRGEAELIDPGDAGRLTLSLEVPDPEPYPRYRLRVLGRADGDEVWTTDQLVKVGGKWLRLDLPADLFEPGEYELEIYGLTSDGPVLLDERYAVKVVR